MTVQTQKLWESSLLRFLLPFLAGMIIATMGWAPTLPWQVLLFVSFSGLSAGMHLAISNRFTRKWLQVVFTLFISIAICLLGIIWRENMGSDTGSPRSPSPCFQLIQRIQESPLQDTSKSFVRAMLLGDKSGIPADTRQLFSRTGVSHILALSGMHIGVIVMLVGWFIPKIVPGRNLLLIAITWAYIGLVGMPVSAIRAGWMLTLWLLHPFKRQQTLPLDVWALAGISMLLYNPNYLTDVSFQLSFAAVGSILFCQPFFFYMPYLPKRIQQWVWVCIAAQMGVMPLSVWYFGHLPVWFLLANALVTPLLLPVTLYLGLMLLLALYIYPPVATIIAPVEDGVLQLMLYLISWVDSLG